MPSMQVYALVEQEIPAVVLFRRTESGWSREVHEGLGTVIALGEIDAELSLGEIYDGVQFSAENTAEELR